MPTVDLSNKRLWNSAYLEVLYAPKTYNILWGGAGSGKSQTMIQMLLAEICNHKLNQEQTFFVIRKVAATLRNSVYADFKNKVTDWGLESMVEFRKGYLEIHSGSNKIVFLGCDDPEKLKSLSQAKAIWIEEATELSLDDFIQVTLRLRGKSIHPKRFYLTFNPVSDTHWIKQRFFDNPPSVEKGNTLILHGTYLDALDFLDDEYPQRMDALKQVSQTYYEVYALGQWGIWDKESLFAPSFDTEAHIVDANIRAMPSLPVYLAFDFNVSNTCIVCQFQKNSNDADTYATVNILKVYRIGDLSALCQTIRAEFPNCTFVINGDASGSNKSAFTSDNINAYQLISNYMAIPEILIQVPRANPSHIGSRLVTLLFFQKCHIRISKPNCKDLIIDLKEAKVDRKGSLDPWKLKNPDKSHALDAFRYFVFSNFAEITGNYNLEKFNGKLLQ
jgi:PBSX family phage terminase large subunit